jgi:hypothetical protein
MFVVSPGAGSSSLSSLVVEPAGGSTIEYVKFLNSIGYLNVDVPASGGYTYNSGATGNTFQDGVIHDTYNATNALVGLTHNANLTMRRVEVVRAAGVNGGPGSGTTTLENNYHRDAFMTSNCVPQETCVHAEFLANENAAGGTVNATWNRFLMTPDIDPTGDPGWTGATKIQDSTATWNFSQNLFTWTGSLAHVPQLHSWNGADPDCPGPINYWSNQQGTSGIGTAFDTATNCNPATHGATKIGCNVDLAGGAVALPGGNVGSCP